MRVCCALEFTAKGVCGGGSGPTSSDDQRPARSTASLFCHEIFSECPTSNFRHRDGSFSSTAIAPASSRLRVMMGLSAQERSVATRQSPRLRASD